MGDIGRSHVAVDGEPYCLHSHLAQQRASAREATKLLISCLTISFSCDPSPNLAGVGPRLCASAALLDKAAMKDCTTLAGFSCNTEDLGFRELKLRVLFRGCS